MGSPVLIRGLAAIVFGAALLLACGSEHAVHAGGVRVSSRLLHRSGRTMIETTFAPERPGFHLYSVDLPDAGINGLGVPTRVRAGDGVLSLGPAVASRQVVKLNIATLGVELPVYPDGAIVLSQVASMAPAARRHSVIVSYGACSATTCLAPVQDQVVRLAQ
jgi:hypothetical protein